MSKTHRQAFLLMLPVGAMAGLFVAAAINGLMPKIYESVAVIEVAQPTGIAPFALGCDWIWGERVARIRGRKALETAIARLDLAERWNADNETALATLRDMVTVRVIRGTDLISIRVCHAEKVLARDIAVEIVRVPKEYLGEIAERDEAETLRKVQDAIRDQEGKVEERRRVLVAIERTLKKNLVVEGAETLLHLPVSQDYIDAKSDYETDAENLMEMKLGLIARESIVPHSEGVVIHQYPVIAESPVSPNVTLNLVSGTLLGVLLSPLMALPMIRVLNRQKTAVET